MYEGKPWPPCGSKFLQYDGHPGYDYDRGQGKSIRGEPILAAARGVVKIPKDGQDNIYSKPQDFKSIFVVHENGFETWYLHPRKHLKKEGETVEEGTPIAEVGCEGLKKCNEKQGYHLHFEVRRTDVVPLILTTVGGVSTSKSFTYSTPIDPYGWAGGGSDPYSKAANIWLWKQ